MGTGKEALHAGGTGGIVPSAIQHIWEVVETDTKHDYQVFVSYLQMYLEKFQGDLVCCV